jgi:hypothetical protein
MTAHHSILKASERRVSDIEAGFIFLRALEKFRIYICTDAKGSARRVTYRSSCCNGKYSDLTEM